MHKGRQLRGCQCNRFLTFLSPFIVFFHLHLLPQNEPGHTEPVAGTGMLHLVPLHPMCNVSETLISLPFKVTFFEVSAQV